MKSVLITGASSGIGLECVVQFVRQGYLVFAGVRGQLEERLELLEDEVLEKLGSPAPVSNLRWVSLDVTDPKQIQNVCSEIQRLSPSAGLDVLVNNAGFGIFGPLESVTDEQWRRQFEVNVFGLIQVTRVMLPLLMLRSGKVFQVSSILGVQGMPFASPYVASKFAVEGLSESLAYELVNTGVQVSVVEPGRHASRFQAAVEWGEEIQNDSIQKKYGKAVEKYRFYRGHQERRSSAPPASDVAVKIFRLAESRGRLPLRVVVGHDAFGISLIRKLLPGQIWHRVVSRLVQQLFRA